MKGIEPTIARPGDNKNVRCCKKTLSSNITSKLYEKRGSEKRFFKYHSSVLKSGFQKYGRRAKVDKGLWCLVEMDLLSLLEFDGPELDAYLRENPKRKRVGTKKNAKGIRTNMINRLVAMISEEVNISAWWMPLKIYELYQNWWKYRNSPLSRKLLVDMYRYLTSQRMIRLISDLKSVYMLPPYYVEPEQMNDFRQIHRGIRAVYPALYSGRKQVGKVDWDLTAYPANIRPCIKGIIYNLEANSDHAFYWISKLCDLEKASGTSKYRYLRLAWSVLYRFIDKHREYEFVKDTISALEFFFKKMRHQEQPIYLYHALLLLIRRNEIDWGSKDPGIDTPIVEVERLYRDHLAGGKMPMDDYILDLHTHGGKRGRDDLENFALEGAYIKNENYAFLRREYREIYVLLKQELDFDRNNGLQLQQRRWNLRKLSHKVGVPIKLLSADVMAKLKTAPHAQLRTSSYKKAVFVVDDLVFKGPYTCNDTRLFRNLKFTYAIQLLEKALDLPEWQRAALPWQCIGWDGNDHYYLVAPNVGKSENIPFDLVSSKIEANVPVIPRCGAVWRVSDVEKNGRMNNGIKLSSLQHLYLRFLLDIGDSGTHNILIRENNAPAERLIAGIDLEEKRAIRTKGSRLDHLFKKAPSKRQVHLYQTEVCKIKSLSYGRMDQDTIDRLHAVGIDLERLKANMQLWDSLN